MITPYQSEDPKPSIPTHWKKEEKMKTIEDENEWAAQANKIVFSLLL